MEFLPDSGHAVPCESGEDHERRHAMRHRSVITARTTRRVAGWIPPCVRSADRSSAFRSAVLQHRRRRLARVVLHLRRLLPFTRGPQPPRRPSPASRRGRRGSSTTGSLRGRSGEQTAGPSQRAARACGRASRNAARRDGCRRLLAGCAADCALLHARVVRIVHDLGGHHDPVHGTMIGRRARRR